MIFFKGSQVNAFYHHCTQLLKILLCGSEWAILYWLEAKNIFMKKAGFPPKKLMEEYKYPARKLGCRNNSFIEYLSNVLKNVLSKMYI